MISAKRMATSPLGWGLGLIAAFLAASAWMVSDARLGAWREPILRGLDHRHLDEGCRLLDAVRRGLASRRPALGFADLRRFALLRAFDVRPEPGSSRPISAGVALAWLKADLTPA